MMELMLRFNFVTFDCSAQTWLNCCILRSKEYGTKIIEYATIDVQYETIIYIVVIVCNWSILQLLVSRISSWLLSIELSSFWNVIRLTALRGITYETSDICACYKLLCVTSKCWQACYSASNDHLEQKYNSTVVQWKLFLNSVTRDSADELCERPPGQWMQLTIEYA